MNPAALQRILNAVAQGTVSPEAAMKELAEFPSSTLSDATVDQQRALRCGFPEVIYGEGKTIEQILDISERIVSAHQPLLATRLSSEAAEALVRKYPDGHHSARGRLFRRAGNDPLPPAEMIAVMCGGTSDLPVAEEAAETAEAMGVEVERVRDVGVAGLHRLMPHQPLLRKAAALVVVAGMEGALPSVIGGLTDRPVIAVPTSIGYGASFGGLAALLAMLNSCSAGVTVVNIDNGFSAGYHAAQIARLAAAPSSASDRNA